MTALKSAAKQMVSTLFEGNDSSSTLKIAVVPFSGAVNIGSDKLNSGWLDKATYTAADASADSIPFEDLTTTANMGPLKLYSPTGLTNRSWSGCVRERSSGGANPPYELTDAPPDAAVPATLWAPYFAPDEPDSSSGTNYSNSYVCDDPTKSWSTCSTGTYTATCYSGGTTTHKRQCSTSKYAGKGVSSTAKGPDFNCPPTAITAMTSTQATINTAIDALTPKGSTVIPAGLLWGWRAISPTAPFTEGAAYDDEKYVKAIILLTDGENDVNQGANGINESSYNAFGFARNGHLGNTSGSNANATLDAKTSHGMQRDQIEGYSPLYHRLPGIGCEFRRCCRPVPRSPTCSIIRRTTRSSPPSSRTSPKA